MTPRSPALRTVLLALLVLLVAAASWLRPLDTAADAQLDRGMKSAFAAFASARALNAAISVAQSARVSAQVGVGMSVSPGEVLDPVDDLVEHFSNFMLAATVAFGAQKVLLAVGAHWVVAAALTATAALWLGLAAARRARPRWLPWLLAMLVLVRFAIPLATIGTDLLFRAFLAPKHEAAHQAFDEFLGQARTGTQPDAGEQGTVATIKGWLSRGTDLGPQLERLANAAGRLAEHVTGLIVAFLLQTLVFPLALSWGLYRGVLACLRPRPGS
jgi:hypothetical protein